jgi:hypothetical protein
MMPHARAPPSPPAGPGRGMGVDVGVACRGVARQVGGGGVCACLRDMPG